MGDCRHSIIHGFTFDDGEPAKIWACAKCSARFVPIDREIALETALRDCVTHMKTAGSPEAVRACEAAERVLGDA